MEKGGNPEALMIAGGAGGLAHGPVRDIGLQHGKKMNDSLPNTTAPSFGTYPAGNKIFYSFVCEIIRA